MTCDPSSIRETLQVNCHDPDNRIILYTDDPHEKIREHFIWQRNFDKNGKQLPQPEMILLKDLDDDHLKTLCYFTMTGYPAKINQVFINEYNYRIDLKEK